MLPVGQHHAGERHLVERSDGLADHSKSIVADLAVRHNVVGADEIQIVDLAAGYELIDFDGAGRLQRDVLDRDSYAVRRIGRLRDRRSGHLLAYRAHHVALRIVPHCRLSVEQQASFALQF